jgi:hypothetical protein
MAIALTATPFAALAADDPALRKGDPARWEEPIATPAQRLENSMKEARNALAEALKECRASAAQKECAAEARAQYQRDVATARKVAADERLQPAAPR